MKLLHTSDWHLGKSLFDFSLLDDQEYMIDSLLQLLEREKVDAVVLAGDIYDRPVPPSQAVQLYDHFLSQAVGKRGIPVVAVAGNHDSASRLEFGSSLYAPSGYYISGQVRGDIAPITLSDRHGPVQFWPFPYLHPADVRAALPDCEVRTYDDAYRTLIAHNLPRLDEGSRNVAIGHGFFSAIGGHDTSLLTSDSEVSIGGMDIANSGVFAPFDYTALGHLHAPQRAGSDVIRYSGSPLKYSLSEERQRKSFTLVELSAKGVVEVQQLPIAPLRDVRTVAGSLEQLLEPSYHQNPQFDDYVFADLVDQGALYPMEKLRKLFPHLLGLRLLGESSGSMPEIRLGAAMPRMSPEEMFLRFYSEVKGQDMPPEQLAFLQSVLEEEL